MENKGKNMYLNTVAHFGAQIQGHFKMFSLDIIATKTAELTGISRPTVNMIYKKIRQRIKHICDHEFPLKGEVEVDESYFGAK